MIEILIRKTKDEELHKIERVMPGCWINMVSPTNDEIESISKKLDIPQDILNDMMDINERPLVDKEPDFSFYIMRIPYKQAENLITIPLGIVIKENIILTVSPFRIPVLTDFADGKFRDFYTTKKTRFLLQIFSRSNFYYMKYLNEIYKQIERREASLRKLRNDDIIYLVELEKSLLYFNTSVTPNYNVLQKILTGKIIKLYKEDEDILEDIIIDTKQTIEMSKISAKIIVNIRDAYSSIITNNLNKILKFLAAVTVVLTIPMIISSLYGMNVNLPLQQNPAAFAMISVSIILLSAALIAFFSYKDWL